MAKKNPLQISVPTFAKAFRTSPAALTVVEKTTRSYEAGIVPHFARLLVAYPALYEALGVDVKPRLATLKVVEPPKRKAGVKVPDAKALVDKLRNEAKVI